MKFIISSKELGCDREVLDNRYGDKLEDIKLSQEAFVTDKKSYKTEILSVIEVDSYEDIEEFSKRIGYPISIQWMKTELANAEQIKGICMIIDVEEKRKRYW